MSGTDDRGGGLSVDDFHDGLYYRLCFVYCQLLCIVWLCFVIKRVPELIKQGMFEGSDVI